tara:strand:- start:320 stop:1432 length:1113 start_codon:yes stop_codon:yes gene_type:complete
MNIILIFTYGISLKNWKEAGLLSREIALYKELNKKYGYKFTFLTYGDSGDTGIVKEFDFINVIPVYSYISFNNLKIINYLKTLSIPFKIKKELKNIDIIKTNQLNGCWVGILLKFLLKKPLIVRTGYNILQFKTLEKKPTYILFFYYLLTQAGIIFSDIYTVTTKIDEASLKRKFYNKNNIVVHQNYVVGNHSKTFEHRHSNRILSVGRLEEQKNYMDIIKNLANTEIHIDIIGDGSQKKDILLKAAENNVKIKLLSPIPNEELMEKYSEYKIFLTGSKFEGNPKAVLEAMSSGCVVISFGNENIKEIIENNKNGILFSNFKEISSLLRNNLVDKEKFEKISSNAVQTINKNYSLNSACEREFQIYNIIK